MSRVMKFLHKLAHYLLVTGGAFWVIETLYFLYRYGWHTSAINEAEKTCDDIVSIMCMSGLVLYLYIGIRIIDEILDFDEAEY